MLFSPSWFSQTRPVSNEAWHKAKLQPAIVWNCNSN